MHKRLFNEAVIELTLAPSGPILIKAGEGASDPTKPDMSFVRTIHGGRETVYLPGSSLKGVLRAHCERLARTVQGSRVLACDPLDGEHSCSKRLEEEGKKREREKREWSGPHKHKESCFLCQLFGNTSLASHFRIADAYPVGECRLEERNGVAIDRVFGSVVPRVLFNYETVTAGEFKTTLQVKNFTLAQLGLLCLGLRDLTAERVRLGFGKSRGLGVVKAKVTRLTLRYPLCILEGGRPKLLGGDDLEQSKLYGVGAFLSEPDAGSYGYPRPDEVELPEGYAYGADGWLGIEVNAPPAAEGQVDWQSLGRACVPRWAEVVNDGR